MLSSGSATTGISGGGVLASNKVNTLAKAFIEYSGAAQGTVNAGGDLTVSATDAAAIDSHANVVQITITRTRRRVSRSTSRTCSRTTTTTRPSRARATSAKGDHVRVGPGDGALGVVGHVYEFKGTLTESIDLGAEDYTVTSRWTDLTVQPSIADYYPNLGNLTKSDARSIGLLIVMNDLRAKSEAYLDNALVAAGGDVTVSAEETAQLASEALTTVTASGGSFYGTGTVQAITGQVVTNVVLASATAMVSDSDVTAGGDVTVSAANHAGIDATLLTAANSGDTAVNVSLAFNSIGWKSQNILFNLADSILGEPLIAGAMGGESPSLVSATITGSTIEAGGDLTVLADGAALLNATVSNAADSTASALFGATGKAVGIVVAQNKVSTKTVASITGGSATADGDLFVVAHDETGIFSNVKIVSSSITTNNGGVPVLQDEIDNFTSGVDFISSEIAADIELGDLVRIVVDQATGDVKKGSIYEWMGEDGVQDLSTQDYTDARYWKLAPDSHLLPQGANFTQSDSMGIGGAIVVNDVSSEVTATIDGTTVEAGNVTVDATESATIQAATDVTASSSGGSSFTGQGQSLAVSAVIATNRVLSKAIAKIIGADVTTTTGDVTVTATNSSVIDATTLAAMTSGSEAVGIELAFNTIGWKRSNLLFDALDALLGDPLSRRRSAALRPRSPRRRSRTPSSMRRAACS